MEGDFSIKDKISGFDILSFIVLLVLVSFMMSVSGYLRLTLGVAVIGAFSLFVVITLFQRSRPVETWTRESKIDEIISRSMLKEESELVRRAYRGRKLSQALLEEELKENFLGKMKREKNLNDDEVEALLDKPKRLRDMIDDEMIFKFIINHKTYKGVVRNKKEESDKGKDEGRSLLSKLFGEDFSQIDDRYKKRMESLIDRMEEWN